MTKAKLFVLKQEIELLWTDMDYVRKTVSTGKPNSEVLGGMLSVGFESTEKTDLLRWMLKDSHDESLNEHDRFEEGKICLYNEGFDNPPSRTYVFNDAYPVYFEEEFDASNEISMMTIMTISPAIQDYGSPLIKSWNANYIPPTQEEPKQSSTNETEELVDCYITDLKNNETGEVGFDDEVYLVVESKNMTGQTKDVDLVNSENKFEYKNEILENNTLAGLSIISDVQKVKLKVVKPQDQMVALEN